MPHIAISAFDAMMRASSSTRSVEELRRRRLIKIANAQHFARVRTG
jgi:hypothetical protein